MKNPRTLLLLSLAGLVLTGANGLGQPAEPIKPVPPAPPAKPRPAPLDSIESQLAASKAALQETKWQLQGGGFSFADSDFRVFGPAGSRTLVIPKDNEDSKELGETEEDLKVMARILEKAASTRDERNGQAMGILVHPFGQASPQNLYIEGYGALFFLNINYPLVAPPVENKEDGESKEQPRSEWQETHDELFRPRGSEPEPFGKTMPGPPPEKYDPEKIETLKKNLISALKNASNVRALKSDESVTIVVTSHAGPIGGKMVSRVTVEGQSSSQSGAKKSSRTIPARTIRTPGGAAGAKLIIRAKKSDINAFQDNKMDLDEFRKKVSLFTVDGN